jgi:NAD(P)H-dependent FMN reductase
MSNDRIHLAVILGSDREGRFGPTVAHWFTDRARRRDDVEVDLIDIVDLGLPHRHPGGPNDAVRRHDERISRADAFVIVTPEYNHSFPGGLKHAIDVVHGGWARKPVGFVSYGGISGGLRAVEHLRPVFAELHATTIRETVSFAMAHGAFEDGQPIDRTGAELAATVLLDDLVWWADALRTARRRDERKAA